MSGLWPRLTLTEEEKKEPLKLVYNSDRSLSFFAPSIGEWLYEECLNQRGIEGASKFEPLMTDENDGIVLRFVDSYSWAWGYLSVVGASSANPAGSVKKSYERYKAAKFKFLPVN